MALLTLLLLETQMRPSEALALAPQQAIAPSPFSKGPAHWLTCIVYPEELQPPSKTREDDHSIPLDLARHHFLVLAAPVLQSRPRGSSKLWAFTNRE